MNTLAKLFQLRLRGLLFLMLVFAQSCAYSQDRETVYVTRTGEKYHRGDCQYLRRSKIDIQKSEAIRLGYTACSVCKPGGTTANNVTKSYNASKPNGQSQYSTAPASSGTTSRQCAATTKAGSRCKRYTTNANGKCWQHQ